MSGAAVLFLMGKNPMHCLFQFRISFYFIDFFAKRCRMGITNCIPCNVLTHFPYCSIFTLQFKLHPRMLQDHVTHLLLLGLGASDELEKKLEDASLFAFSSDWEGLPNALMEAMALGLPIVATDCPCGGPATLIRDGENGLLVPIKDADAMAAGILRLIEDRELAERLGDNARRIGEEANTEAICRQWKEYIEELCRK